MKINIPFLDRKPTSYALLFRETRDIDRVKLTVKEGHLVDEDWEQGWGNLPGYLTEDKKTGIAMLPICERDATPLDVFDIGDARPKVSAMVKDIAANARRREQFNVEKNAEEDRRYELLQITLLVLGISVVIIALVILISSGAIDFSAYAKAFQR